MAQFQIKQFLNLRNDERLLPRWDLIRGLENEYDSEAQSGFTVPTGTDWIVHGHSDFSIDGGTVSITPDFGSTVDYSSLDLSVDTNQGISLIIPVTVRNYFPSDFPIDVGPFFSSFRSFDPSSREIWRANYISPTSAFTTQEVSAQTTDEGYLDRDRLESDCLAIGDPGILEVTRIINQTGSDGGLDLQLSESNDTTLLAGSVQNSGLGLLTQNGHSYFRANWSVTDLDPSWSGLLPDRGQVHYVTSGSGISLDDVHGFMNLIRRRGPDSSNLRIGDKNSFPGHRTDGARSIKYNTYNAPTSISMHSFQITEWFVVFSDTLRISESSSSTRRRRHFVRGVSLEFDADRNFSHDRIHSGTGGMLQLQSWDWAEFSLWSIHAVWADSESYRDNILNNVNDLVQTFGNQTFVYT